MNLNLSDFLLARFADEEAVARAAIGKRVDISATWSDTEVSRHIDRWSSARVLAECEAKRRIVQYVVAVQMDDGPGSDRARAVWWIATQMAKPYADHPDYREEWKA